ncbi:MAG: hypothetical protein SH847_26550, partial [Roseiflexaceae bacterium]|nr:hypothetical protein [Roseiflexaceae bacterium]
IEATKEQQRRDPDCVIAWGSLHLNRVLFTSTPRAEATRLWFILSLPQALACGWKGIPCFPIISAKPISLRILRVSIVHTWLL